MSKAWIAGKRKAFGRAVTMLERTAPIAANTGYRPGRVHFSVRSAAPVNLINFLRSKAPDAADENYGGGHERASGGALRAGDWNELIARLGFGPDMQVGA